MARKRKWTMSDSLALALFAVRIREEVDGTLADLIDAVARGDESALRPAVDRLIELGRDEQAARLKALVEGEP